MSTPSPLTKLTAYFTVEVKEPQQGKTEGMILAASVENPNQVFNASFNTEHPVDEALEGLLSWARSKIDSSTHEIELVIWNKDAFARLTSDLGWLSLNSTCFISYYAALMSLPTQRARFALQVNNLSVTNTDRPKRMAEMFKNLLVMSQAIEKLREIWGVNTLAFPQST